MGSFLYGKVGKGYLTLESNNCSTGCIASVAPHANGIETHISYAPEEHHMCKTTPIVGAGLHLFLQCLTVRCSSLTWEGIEPVFSGTVIRSHMLPTILFRYMLFYIYRQKSDCCFFSMGLVY